MGTTLTMLLVCGDRAVVAHVGDSRLYRIRRDRVELITHDHTVEAELDRRGIALDDAVRQSRMAKMLTRSLGERGTVSVESQELPLETGDVLILCSDGLEPLSVGWKRTERGVPRLRVARSTTATNRSGNFPGRGG